MKRQSRKHQWWARAGYCALIVSAAACSGNPGLEKMATVVQDVVTAGRAPDATGPGPFRVATAEYRFSATMDPTIFNDRATEIWARLWRPQSSDELDRLPLVIFLHGNHGTCGTFFCRAVICGVPTPLPDGPRIDDRRDYTDTGTCPRRGEGTPPAESDYVVTPNHEGYAYLAEQLASHGYLVVSINANRGITAGRAQDLGTPGMPFIEDRGLNLARARLVLKHLELLSRWNRGLEPTPSSLGFDLRGRVDFGRLALVGHSRGGEGVRGAYNIYTGRNTDISPYSSIDWRARIADAVDFKGIFEIAPVDRQTVRTLNAEGTTWSTMLPGCDGDVINQQGMWPFDRMMKSFTEQPQRLKSFYYVIGANHNFWNTEWQFSDSSGCFSSSEQLFETDPRTGVLPGVTGSENQRTTGSASILALIRGSTRSLEDREEDFPRFLTNFDPQFELPPVIADVARVQRGFIASPSSEITRALEDFDQPTGTSQFGVPNQTSNVTVEHVPVTEHGFPFLFRDPRGALMPHPAFVRAGRVTWRRAGADVYFQINFTSEGSGLDLSRYATLDLRMDRESPKRTSLNPAGATNFHVQLVASDASLSAPVAVSDFIDLVGPFGTPDADLTTPTRPDLPDGYHLNMPTARIPLRAFRFHHSARTRGIRLTFDDTASGMIYVTNFRASLRGIRSLDEGAGGSHPSGSISNASKPVITAPKRIITEGNLIEDVRFVPAAGVATKDASGTVHFLLWSETPVLVTDELLKLAIGPVECDGSYADASLQRMTFECPADAIRSLPDGEPISIGNNARVRWSFGTFSKALLK